MSDDIMSQEIFTIDTGANIKQEQKIEPLSLFDDNHPMLSKPIPEYVLPLPNPNMNILINRLKMTMKQFSGLGLSANQCGVFERVFVIGTEHFQFACINPKIIDQSAEMIKDNEGCLSYPALYLKIERPSWIMASFYNERGERVEMKMEGLTARCFQHELDHMNGVKFIEHVGPVSLRLAKQKQDKIIKTITRKRKHGK
jgi:peptide deformylase